MTDVRPLVPRPPTRLAPFNEIELTMMIAALDHSESVLRREAPDEHAAHRGMQMLRRRLEALRVQLACGR